MNQRKVAAALLQRAWLQHAESSAPAFASHAYSTSSPPHSSSSSSDTAGDEEYQASSRYQPNEPAYLSMGQGNKTYATYFAKLRRKYDKLRAFKHPMSVPWDHVFDNDLEMFRRHNTTLPVLVGQTIICKIIAIDKYRDILWFDTGYRFPARFYKHQLNLQDVVATKDGPLAPDSPTKAEWELGDVVYFVIEDLQTPFLEMQLRPVSRSAGMHTIREVMQELQMKHAKQEVVMGRVLNEMHRGYAVGIAGVIAFCPLNACSPLTARRIGVLQPFYIKHMPTPGGESNTVVLEDAKIARTIRRVSQPPLFGYDRGPTGFSGLPGMPPPRADR